MKRRNHSRQRFAVSRSGKQTSVPQHPTDKTSRQPRRPRRLLVLSGVSFLLVAIAIWRDTPCKVTQYFAKRAVNRFDYESATQWLRWSRTLSNRSAETELIAARIARRQGRIDQHQQLLQRARLLGADRNAVRLEELLALSQTGAIATYEEELIAQMVLPGAETDEISDAYANGLAAASRFDDAISVLSAWMSDYPDDPRPHYRMGRLHEHSERWQDAETAYRSAIERHAKFYSAWYALGRAYMMSRKIDQAMDAYSNCLDTPRPQAAKIQLAACFRAKGESAAARNQLNEVLADSTEAINESYRDFEESPEYFDAATQLGDLEAEAENFEKAIHWYRTSLDFNPRDLVARYGLALSLRTVGKTDIAEQEFERVGTARKALELANPLRDRIAKNREDLEARLELGKLLLEHESVRMGLFWIRSTFAFDPNYGPAHAALAEHYQAQLPPTSADQAAGNHHRIKAAATSQTVSGE